MLIFTEGRKLEDPEKNPRGKGENQQTTQLTCSTWAEDRTQTVQTVCLSFRLSSCLTFFCLSVCRSTYHPFIFFFFSLCFSDGVISKEEMKNYFLKVNCQNLTKEFSHAFQETTYFTPTFCYHCGGLVRILNICSYMFSKILKSFSTNHNARQIVSMLYTLLKQAVSANQSAR
jgi:hypothetical protein